MTGSAQTLAELQAQLVAINQSIAADEAQIRNNDAEINRCNYRMEGWYLDIEILEDNRDTKQAELNTAYTQRASTITYKEALVQQRSQRQSQVTQDQNSLSAVNAAIIICQQNLAALQAELAHPASEDLSAIYAAIDEVNGQLEELYDTQSLLMTNISILLYQIDDLSIDISVCDDMITEYSQTIALLQIEIQSINTQINILQQNIADQAWYKSELLASNQRLQAEIASLNAQAAQVQAQIDALLNGG